MSDAVVKLDSSQHLLPHLVPSLPISDLLHSSISHIETLLPLPTFRHTLRALHIGILLSPPSVDNEVLALAILFHDVGMSPHASVDSHSTRFEVTGANAARDFIQSHATPDAWPPQRVQLVWDSIALHTINSIAEHKEAEVQAVVKGIDADWLGIGAEEVKGKVSAAQWEEICEKWPRRGMKDAMKEAACRLCREVPETTWVTFTGSYGLRYVDGYTWDGKLGADWIEGVAKE